MLIEEFFNAGIFDFQQLLDPDENTKSCDDLSIDFGLAPNDCIKHISFLNHVKLISAVPWSWLHKTPTNQQISLFKEKIQHN